MIKPNNGLLKVNTIREAKTLSTSKFTFDKDRMKHTTTVVENCRGLAKLSNISVQQLDTLLQAAYLHDIGYSRDLKVTGFHPYDGYVYLKEKGWNEDVCLLVLHHSEASTLPHPHNLDLHN
ncbi:HD domain-containing protein, partial [Lysinibacillus xylanilyticus]|uniref:HD domain-containing protein n=1 Tax=Lysinibacillus xylanilyticus TaxID=582475 RepID=UPI0036D922B6